MSAEQSLRITKTRLMRERIDINGDSYRRFIVYPLKVFDNTPRCISCGQIDDQPWHDWPLCMAIGEWLAETPV